MAKNKFPIFARHDSRWHLSKLELLCEKLTELQVDRAGCWPMIELGEMNYRDVETVVTLAYCIGDNRIIVMNYVSVING